MGPLVTSHHIKTAISSQFIIVKEGKQLSFPKQPLFSFEWGFAHQQDEHLAMTNGPPRAES